MRRFLPVAFFLLIVSGSAFAALQFPALTGRVVDEAGILSPATQSTLTQSLADYESRTSNQVVVVTLRSLEGTSIEDYGYQLGRHWGIGLKGKDNGVLLIVAPQEHKVRIEVGYGLEGILTDALSSEIIHEIILPAFRTGHLEQGVVAGTEAILDVLGGKDLPPHPAQNASILPALLITLFILFIFIGKTLLLFDPRFYLNHPFLAFWLLFGGGPSLSGSRSGGFPGLSGGGFSGGFSGGGGSFGGGGASGGW